MVQLWNTWLWITLLCLIVSTANCDPCRDEVLHQCMYADSSSFWTCTITCISEDHLPATEHQEDHLEEEDSSSSSTSENSRSERAADGDCAQCTCECILQWPRMSTTCSDIITQCASPSTTSSILLPDTLTPGANTTGTSDSNVVAPVLISLAVIVVVINVMGLALFVGIKVRKHRRMRTETLPPWPQDSQVIQSSLHNPVYGVEEFVSSPTTPTEFSTPTPFTTCTPSSQTPIYEEVDVSITYCSEEEPEKLLHNPLYSDVTHSTTAPQVPPHFKPQNHRTGEPTAAVHAKPVRRNIYSSDGSTDPVNKAYRNQEGQTRVPQGEYETYPTSTEIPAQDYSKLDPSNQYACLEPHRGGKPTKMITTPPSVDDEYSHLEY